MCVRLTPKFELLARRTTRGKCGSSQRAILAWKMAFRGLIGGCGYHHGILAACIRVSALGSGRVAEYRRVQH